MDAREKAIISTLDKLSALDVFIIVSKCLQCGDYYGVKDGQGVHGISHGYCNRECVDIAAMMAGEG